MWFLELESEAVVVYYWLSHYTEANDQRLKRPTLLKTLNLISYFRKGNIPKFPRKVI